jgi:hypothetical protein
MNAEKMGFPQGVVFCGLSFSEPANMLIAHVQLEASPGRVLRLYGRGSLELDYRDLVPAGPDLSLEDPTGCPSTTYLYYNQKRWADDGFSWEGLFQLDLRSGAINTVVDRSIGECSEKPFWISRIIGISSDGMRLFVVVGRYSASRPPQTVEYFLSTLSIPTRNVTDITHLQAAFA